MPRIDQRRLDHRLERFDLGTRSPRSSLPAKSVENDLAFQSKPMVDENGVVDWDAITIKGTSTNLEKDYLRLTQVCAMLHRSVLEHLVRVQSSHASLMVLYGA